MSKSDSREVWKRIIKCADGHETGSMSMTQSECHALYHGYVQLEWVTVEGGERYEVGIDEDPHSTISEIRRDLDTGIISVVYPDPDRCGDHESYDIIEEISKHAALRWSLSIKSERGR